MPSEFNRAAAFLEYSKGTSLEDISHALAIPLNHLQRWSHEENWPGLAPKLPAMPVTRRGAEAEKALVRIKENREKNLRIAQELQQDLIEVIQKLRAGKLRVVKAFANGTKQEMEPGLRDRNDLALYARNVAEMSYRALGDVQEGPKNAQNEASGASAGQITIILPPAVAAPRQERAVDIGGEVVDLRPPALIQAGKDAESSGIPVASSFSADSCVTKDAASDTAV